MGQVFSTTRIKLCHLQKYVYIYTVLNSTTGKHKVILDNGIKKKPMIEKSGASSQTLSDFQAAEGGINHRILWDE